MPTSLSFDLARMRRCLLGAALLLAWGCSGAVAVPDAAAIGPGQSMALQAENLKDGSAFDIGQLAGKVVLVDVWASWCPPCLEALPFFADLYRRHGARGLEVVALGVDEERATAQAFATSLALPFTVLWDRDHRAVQALGVPKMPTSFLIDRQGRVREVFAGFRPEHRAEIEAKMLALLAAPADAAR